MANKIADDKIQEVLRAANIVEIISEVVTLKHAGNNLVGLCPFHEEKTPSFSVSPSKQVFHCFGCKKGGTVFTFVMEHEKATFPEVVRALGKRYGIVIEDATPADLERERTVEGLYRVLKWAADVYHKQFLTGPESAACRDYVRERGLSDESIAQWRLGHGPEEWDFLLRRARKASVPEGLLVEAGLAVRKDDGRMYDRFRGRWMFPIFDPRDRVVGFGGRILPGSSEKEQSKYINTAETPLFSKGRLLYGINFAREKVGEEGALAIMEGYTDVILAHQHGYRCAIATLGTALTRDHLRLMRRFTDRIIAVYDGDSAGTKASERSLDIFLEEELEFRIATLPDELDPADLLQQRGTDAFRTCVQQAVELFQYRLDVARRQHDCTTVAGKAQAVDTVLTSILASPNAVKRQFQLERLARDMDVPMAALLRRLEDVREHLARTRTAPSNRAAGPAPTSTPPPGPPAPRPEPISPQRKEAARELIELVLAAPDLIPRVRAELQAEDYPSEPCRQVLEQIYAWVDAHGTLEPAAFVGSLADPRLVSRLTAILAESAARSNHAARLEELLQTLSLWRSERQVRVLKRQTGDDDGLRAFWDSRRALDAKRRDQ